MWFSLHDHLCINKPVLQISLGTNFNALHPPSLINEIEATSAVYSFHIEVRIMILPLWRWSLERRLMLALLTVCCLKAEFTWLFFFQVSSSLIDPKVMTIQVNTVNRATAPASPTGFCQIFKEAIPVFLKPSHKIETRGTLPNSFWGQHHPVTKTRQGLNNKLYTNIPDEHWFKISQAKYLQIKLNSV